MRLAYNMVEVIAYSFSMRTCCLHRSAFCLSVQTYCSLNHATESEKPRISINVQSSMTCLFSTTSKPMQMLQQSIACQQQRLVVSTGCFSKCAT